MEPLKTHTVVTRRKVVAGYSGPDATASLMEEMNKLIVMDIFCALSSPSFDVRRKVLDICLSSLVIRKITWLRSTRH